MTNTHTDEVLTTYATAIAYWEGIAARNDDLRPVALRYIEQMTERREEYRGNLARPQSFTADEFYEHIEQDW